MPTLSNEFENKEPLILRDHLALQRTKLANERTLFSYIRTALYLLTGGIGILQVDSVRHLIVLAWVCIIAGTIILGVGIWNYFRLKQDLKTYYIKQE